MENPALEQQLFAWIMEQRKAELAVSTTNIIDKAAFVCPDFKDGNEKKRLHWDYKFLRRYKLSVRTGTRVSQITANAMLPVANKFRRRIMTCFIIKSIILNFFY